MSEHGLNDGEALVCPKCGFTRIFSPAELTIRIDCLCDGTPNYVVIHHDDVERAEEIALQVWAEVIREKYGH